MIFFNLVFKYLIESSVFNKRYKKINIVSYYNTLKAIVNDINKKFLNF